MVNISQKCQRAKLDILGLAESYYIWSCNYFQALSGQYVTIGDPCDLYRSYEMISWSWPKPDSRVCSRSEIRITSSISAQFPIAKKASRCLGWNLASDLEFCNFRKFPKLIRLIRISDSELSSNDSVSVSSISTFSSVLMSPGVSVLSPRVLPDGIEGYGVGATSLHAEWGVSRA